LDNTRRDDFEYVVIEEKSASLTFADIYWHRRTLTGYGRSMNLGVAAANGDLIVGVSNDLVLPPDWLPTLVADYKRWGPGFLSPIPKGEREFPPGLTRDSLWFPMWITDRKTWQQLRGFDELLSYRFCDQDMAIRARQMGFLVGQTANVVVEHAVDSPTYSRISHDEIEKAERLRMRLLHGVEHFHEWVKKDLRIPQMKEIDEPTDK
jgi:GT2 family glycosyltransferase